MKIDPFTGKPEEEKDPVMMLQDALRRQDKREKAKSAIVKMLKKNRISIKDPNSPQMIAFLQAMEKKVGLKDED